ncbi:MAG: Rne/Rng family ribonuclease [Tissierellia bacterium]|nr:Rne/Rng family ribonuclease [Tissierellia bacterium]
MNYIFIDSEEGIDRVGIVEDDKLVEFYMDKKDKRKQVGNIYRARVVNVLPGMEAAFVDIGEGKNAYLHVKNAIPKELMHRKRDIKINEIIKNGEEIIVQVLKEASQNKGAKVTTHITLPGRFLVLTPFSSRISISRKIHEKEEIQRLQNLGKGMQKENMGIIFRTNSFGVDEDLLVEEYHMLINIYKKIERERNFLPCPKLIYSEMDLAQQIIRDVFNDKIDRVIVNNRQKYKKLLSFQDILFPKLSDKLIYDANFSITSQPEIEKGLKTALDRKVSLKSGGYIVIDETEALTVIDVNTGKFIGSKNLEDTVVKTNLEAAEEISRQIRLRDIGGIIVIDFIDMKEDEDVDLVLNVLQKNLNQDRNKTNIIGMTKLGLVELTRRKVRNSLSSNFIVPCPSCGGRGKIFS